VSAREDTMGDYRAEIEYDLLGKRWVIRVRYRTERGGWARFVLVPRHQGMMFSEACADIEPAIAEHREHGGAALRPGYSDV